MKITQEADYGLRVVLCLSKLEYGDRMDAGTMSEHDGIPLRFLLKLIRKLMDSGIIKSYRGVNGGYALNKLPENIKLRDVVEAIDGPICVNRCLIDPEFCNAKQKGKCEIHRALDGVQQKLLNELEKINFKDLKEGKY